MNPNDQPNAPVNEHPIYPPTAPSQGVTVAEPALEPAPKKPNHILEILLLFGFPLLIALIGAAAIYVPQLLAQPKYDFVYSHCESYDCEQAFSVDQNGRIIDTSSQSERSKEKSTTYDYYSYSPDRRKAQLYYYDISAGTSTLLSHKEAGRYQLDAKTIESPDGYRLTRSSSGGEFLFWGGDSQQNVLQNGFRKKLVTLVDDNGYSDDTTVIGWVKK